MSPLGSQPRQIDVLLVEDNPGDFRLTEEAFKEGEVKKTLHWVQDGLQALDFLRRRGKYAGAVRPDIIVLDLNLPKLSGRELLAQIKADERLKSVPVIVLTTSRADDDVRAAYGLHANCYITKPADLDRFLAIVKLIDHFWLDVVTLPAMRGEDTA